MPDTHIAASWREILPYVHRAIVSIAGHNAGSLAISVDHVLPKGVGGATAMDNLAVACLACNLAKSDRIGAVDPLTALRVPLFNPRKQR